ncbi:MAG: protoheme IX farnesyltransferase [Saprospiraceae bacterium]|nr:protoheme IX farnesyltransferase [Saprospiraceae bacterium]MBP7699366.1 protoheme IX farnesyltransferase [Saprospiraceae bacterium]
MRQDTITNSNSTISWVEQAKLKLRDYRLLVKFNLSFFVVFSAVIAYGCLAPSVSSLKILTLAVGGFLITGAANALNQILEKDYDKLMKRTAIRPLPSGRMTNSEAVLAAGFFCLIGVTLLSTLNAFTGLLSMVSLICYAFIYTPLKRVTPLAVAVGAIPGALPILIGSVAAEGYISLLAMVLFSIQFLWQFPHFWAIAWVGHEDYTNAGFRLLPNSTNTKDASVGFQAFIYCVLLIGIFPAAVKLNLIRWTWASAGMVTAVVFAYYAWLLFRRCSKEAALQLMFASFFFLPIVLMIFLLDKYL